MNADDHVRVVPATPEYVLSVFVDSHRQGSQVDFGVDSEAVLTFETTVDEWQFACDLLGWRKLGRALNEMWLIDYSDDEWHAVLRPERVRTLRDVCEFVAARAKLYEIIPTEILGKECLPAGAFFAICATLHAAGIDIDDIKPSTPLHKYTRKHAGIFMGPVSRLAPGAIPAVSIKKPLLDSLYQEGLGIAVTTLGVWVLSRHWFNNFFVGCTLLALSSTALWLGTQIAATIPPRAVTFGDLKTFGDMARHIARHTAVQS